MCVCGHGIPLLGRSATELRGEDGLQKHTDKFVTCVSVIQRLSTKLQPSTDQLAAAQESA